MRTTCKYGVKKGGCRKTPKRRRGSKRSRASRVSLPAQSFERWSGHKGKKRTHHAAESRWGREHPPISAGGKELPVGRRPSKKIKAYDKWRCPYGKAKSGPRKGRCLKQPRRKNALRRMS